MKTPNSGQRLTLDLGLFRSVDGETHHLGGHVAGVAHTGHRQEDWDPLPSTVPQTFNAEHQDLLKGKRRYVCVKICVNYSGII